MYRVTNAYIYTFQHILEIESTLILPILIDSHEALSCIHNCAFVCPFFLSENSGS